MKSAMSDAQFPDIADYGIIGDGCTAALISSSGALEWLCMPHIDSASIFAAILDRKRGGAFTITSADGNKGAQSYWGQTNILKTTFEGERDAFEVIDCMPIKTAQRHSMRPEREILRIIRPLRGSPKIRISFKPAPDFGRQHMRLRRKGPATWTFASAGALFIFHSQIPLQYKSAYELTAEFDLSRPISLSLAYTHMAPALMPVLGDSATKRLQETHEWWESWVENCNYKGPYRTAVLRSALALKLLQFSLSGALAAAATTSLPEAIGAGRNWDYRYCWLRDSSFTLRGFIDLGFWREGKAFFDWLMHSTRLTQPHLQPLYKMFGGKNISEHILGHLSGYENSAPVRLGNAAAGQFQLDVYGAVISAARDFVSRGHRLDAAEERLLIRFGRRICKKCENPDYGIWEIRGAPRHYTYSKVMAWAGLNDLLWLAEQQGLNAPRALFRQEREKLHHQIMTHAIDPGDGHFKGAFDHDFADAALLLLPRLRFIEARDPHMEATWNHIHKELEHHGMLQRYSEGVDRLEGKEGTFVACTFWAVEYLASAGRLEEAIHYFEGMLKRMSMLGLCAEEYDPVENRMLGNFPQAFSHTGLISAALAIETASKQKSAS